MNAARTGGGARLHILYAAGGASARCAPSGSRGVGCAHGLDYIWMRSHTRGMTWQVLFHDEFKQEFDAWEKSLRIELVALSKLLAQEGPALGRPWVDTLNGSRYANMKELRFSWRGAPWRVAFAFDPQRQAVLLVGGTKSGVSQRRFYARLIHTADARYGKHLESLKKGAENGNSVT